jgi:predicted dehydrogenase
MKTWNIGVVGAGLIADFHARAVNDISNAKLIGFCDSGSGSAKKLAEKYSCRRFEDYQKMIESDGIDIVTVATPSGFHAEPTIAAAKAGKHVICEKPLDVTLERIDSMIEAHQKAGTKLCGIFPCRFNDSLVPLKQAIDAGRFGVITYAGVYVPWWRTDEYYKDSWHGTWKLDGGGALMNQSIHMVDMLCFLMPVVESIQAFTATLGHPQIEAEDTAVAVLRFSNGALGTIYGTTASFPGQFRRFEITGTKGTVVYVEDSITVWQFTEEKPEDEQIRNKFGQVGSKGGVADPAALHRRQRSTKSSRTDTGYIQIRQRTKISKVGINYGKKNKTNIFNNSFIHIDSINTYRLSNQYSI